MGMECQIGGRIKDYITGREMAENDDELIRQSMERLLVEEKGYEPAEIEVDRPFDIVIGEERHKARAELLVSVKGQPFMIIKSVCGSLVTREREALAASRLACDAPVPVTVVTNGREAETMDTSTGRVVARGLEAIPAKDEALAKMPGLERLPLTEDRREKEGRIYLAFADFRCPNRCDLG